MDMEGRRLPQNTLNIKTEPISPKKVSLPGPTVPSSAIKREGITRLPSFKPPRDLSLSGSTSSQSIASLNNLMGTGSKSGKRVYMPNINVVRKKGSNTSGNDSSPQTDPKNKNKDQAKKPAISKRKAVNAVQTKGVFSEGLAPGKVKAYSSAYDRAQSDKGIMDKPKLNLNAKVIKKNEDSKLKALLRDDFIDDPSQQPDISFIPNSLPIVYNIKNKRHDSQDIEKTFEYLHMKTENVTNMDIKNDRESVLSIFEENENPKMLLFEFPKTLPEKEENTEKKKSTKNQGNETEAKAKVKHGSLTNLGEGLWGYLRIHENGKAYFVIGKHIIPVVLTRHLTRQELMSTNIDNSKSKGEVINLGTIDATFTCSTNFFQNVS